MCDWLFNIFRSPSKDQCYYDYEVDLTVKFSIYVEVFAESEAEARQKGVEQLKSKIIQKFKYRNGAQELLIENSSPFVIDRIAQMKN